MEFRRTRSLEQLALRHFRKGQMSAWIGDDDNADKEFRHVETLAFKAKSALNGNSITDTLTEVLSREPRRKIEKGQDVFLRQKGNLTGHSIPLTCSVIQVGPMSIEVRGMIRLRGRKLAQGIARIEAGIGQSRLRQGAVSVQWIEVTDAFTASFVLGRETGILHGTLHMHGFLPEPKDHRQALEGIGESIVTLITNRLQ